MSNDNKKRLYDALSSTYDLGTFEDFSKDIEDEDKRRKLYDATQEEYDFGAYEDFSSQLGYTIAPSAREQLQAFYQENGAFLDDFEKRDTADNKLSAAESMDGGFSLFGAKKNNSLVTDEERKQYGVLDAQRKQLEKAWYTSDEYLSQKNAAALELGQMRDDIHNSKKAYVESQPQIKMSGLENAVMEGKTIGDYESQQFDIAARIMDKTIKLHNAPSKYDSNSGLKNMGVGAADKATDPALLSAGLTEITDNVGARVVLQKVQKELGNLNDLSEEKIEKILSPAEKAVLRSWARYAQEQLNRQGDLSLGYQAGQGAVESLAFMAEFALTGGVGKAASEGAETLAKWLGKKWYGFKGLGDEAAEAVMKAAGEKALGKYGQKLGLALAETAGRTLVMPSTYRNISEKATEIKEDKDGNRYLIGLNDAFIKGYADSFIENLSEGGRVNALGELVGDIAGNIPAWKKMVNAFSNTKASEILKRLNSTGIMNTLRAGGWHGFGEEYLEEWYGNALRTITGVDKNALKDFATLDNQMVTLASFLPITIFGGTVSTGQVISAKRDLDKKAEALQSALMGRGYDEAQAKNMIDMMRAETPQGISNLITPLIRRVAGANENEARELAKPAMEFAWAVQRYQSYDTKYSYQQQKQRDNLKADMETKLGKFWMEGEDGQQTVQRGVNEKGEVVYLLGKKDIEETADGIGAEKEVAAIDAEGNHIFVFPSDYRLEEELPMNDFLGIEIMTQKRDSEAARMASERDAKFAEVKSRSRLGTQLNIGTNEAPVVATISKVDADGVVVETPEGFRKITYTELANKYADINPAVYTDAELDEQEADNISAERAQREAALDQEYENDDDAIEELAEAENEIEQSVEEATKLPLKDDGTVDQAALWNESPARWAKWNDEQKQDGGVDTLAYLNTAIKAQTAKIEQLVAAQEAETDFDRRDAIAAELSEARMRQGDLLALHGQYTAQVEAQAIQQQAAQPVQPAPQLTEEEKAALEEERRKPLRAKAKELSEKLGVKVKIAEDLSDVKESKAREQLLKSVVSNGKQKVAGWYNQATGEVTIFLPHAESVEDVENTFIHEVVAHKGLRGLLGEEGFNVLCDAVWDMMSEGDRNRFINYPGVDGDKRAAADEYMAHFAETLNLEEAKPDMWERIVAIIKQILDSMGVRLRINQEGLSSVIAASYQKLLADAKAAQEVSAEAVTEAATETIAEEPQTGGAEVISKEQLSAPYSGEAQQIIASDGEVLADTDGKGGVRFSIRTWEEGGRDYLAAWLANDAVLTEEEKADILARMDEFYKNALLYSDTYVPFGTWSDAEVRYDNNGNPLMSVVKANGDYAMNLDFSLVCKKRRPLNRLLRTLINRNAFGSYDLKEREIAEINWILQEHGFEVACALCFVDSKRYRVAGVADVFAKLWNNLVTSLAPKGVQIAHFNYNGNPNVEPVENGLDALPDDQLNWKKLDKAIANFKKGSVEYKVAQYLREHPEARKLVDATDFIEAEGFEAVKEANPDLLKFYNMKKGTGGPKASFGDVQYLNDILKSGKKFDAEKTYAVGGVRLQSFSDFVPHMYFDYMQLFAELAAKKLPVHTYTKEPLFAKIFGLTGAKINLSLVPAVVEGGVAPGLDAEGNYAWADPVVDAEGNVIQQGQTFPYGEAMDIQRAEGYSKNCGAIAVGISDAHIEKMLDDSNIPFIIPYHKSSLNAIVARMTNIDQYKDYTNVQNTRKASGSKLDKSIKDFNFNEYLHGLGESGTPQMAAQAYLDWCRENKFIPKFSQFAYHPNYYKLLQDFNTIDLTTGEYAPQGAVTMTFPTEESAFGNVETLIQQGLQEDAALEEKMEQEIDGIADQVVARLEEIAKEPKMSDKQRVKKMAELADERMAKIKEQSGVIDLVEEAKKAVAREDAKDNVSFRITPEQDKAYMDAVEVGDMDAAQRFVDEAAEAAGYTIRGEHGRVSKFNIFDRDKANPEGNWGKGFYFTNNEEDVESNYATVDGPDLEAKIEREVERRINLAEMNEEFDENGEVDEFAIREAVEDEFITSEPNVVHAAIRMDNPFVVGHGMVEIGEDGLGHYDMEETYLTTEYETDEDGEVDFSVEPTGTLVDLVEALNEELSEYEGVNIDASEILMNNLDGMTAAQFEQEARELLESKGDYLLNDNLEIMASEILRAAIERAGFDGIVDNTVNQKFGSARKFGRAMEGVDRNTRHYIVFQSSQIKQTDAVTYDDAGNVIPLSERFNPENGDVRFRVGIDNSKARDLFKDPETNQFFVDKNIDGFNRWLKEHAEDVVRLYHGTGESVDVANQGLLRTTNKRRRSYQSTPGYVYLSLYPSSAQLFGELAYPYESTKVYAVTVKIKDLKPDTDQLANKRYYDEDLAQMGNTLAESLIYASGARVKRNILPYEISEDIRFRMREEGESPLEFEKNSLEDFRKEYRVPTPTTVVDINDRNAVATALGYTPEEFTDEYYDYLLDGYEVGGSAIYDPETKRIAIFAKESYSRTLQVYDDIFHENTHGLIDNHPELLELGEWLWNNAEQGLRKSIKESIIASEMYDGEETNEMLSGYTGFIMALGKADVAYQKTPAELQKHWDLIFNAFGYGPKRENNLRRRGTGDNTGGVGSSRNGGNASEQVYNNASQEALSAEERRIIGEYFPEFNKSEDVRFRTSLELDEEFGDAWRNQQNEDGRHSTQVANTKSTYEKIGHYLEDAGMKGASILDASSGLGLGTQALREMGFQVDDVEPFPSENREAPTFSSYADIDGKYDVVISNAVLNVIPDDWRADVLHQMADAVKEGGKMIINTRPASNIAQQGVEGKTRITLDSPSEILVKRGDRIAAYQKGFTSEELAEWIKSELGEEWRVEKATKKNSGISGEGTAVVIKESDDTRFRTIGTPTDEVVANGVDLTPSQTSEVAANIFAALPEESRKKITEGLNGNILGLKDAILQIPTSLASKENWNDEDRAMADIVAEEMTKMAGEMTRPFSAPEALWLLYNNLNKSTDLVSLAQRSLVQRNLGFDAQTLATENEAKESLRFRQVGDARINATASLYNKGAVNAMTRLKESFVDMNASVEELVKAIEERTGKKAEGFENILWALNQQSSRGLAAMEDYERRFLNPMYDAIRNIMDKGDFKYEDVVRYVILKHGLERNKKLAQRDAKAHYQEIYDEIIEKINSMDDRQKRTYLTNAQLKEADAKAKLATLQAKDTSTLTEDEMKEHKKGLAVARKEVKEAEEYRERAEKIRNMSEQEAKDELDKIFEKIENGTDSIYKELRESDYSGLTSMFYDQLGVDRNLFATEEAYQSALMDAKEDKYSSLEEVEAAAEAEVNKFEGAIDTKELWKRVNAATKETLRQQYEANMISKDQYLNLRDMFEYYVPLRGFKDNTAEDMYTYYRKPNSTGYTKPILGAEGRKTEAESPFGWIASMAGSAIASNVKNEAKLALFYFVSNRPENGIATISKTWFVDSGEVDERGKKIFKPAYPPFSEDLSSAEGKAQYEIWQANMKELQKKGQAYEAGQRLNLGNAVVNISDANKPEHIVAVKVGGKEYTIVINGNPRAAQAINGELNLEGTADDYSALFGPVLRWMSSVNTSYNPEFWITNMMQDMAFTWMAVNTKGADDKEYRRKFSENYRKAFKVISLVAKNEKGTLGNSPIEQAYKDFVENGGVTGYTQIKDNETWEKEIEQYLKSNDPESLKSGKMMRGMKTVFHVAHRFGESLEQVSRFAAFLTAQEMGKSINEAINDAKEITVNFNRKGSGKMISLEEAKHLTDKNGRPLSKPKQWMVVGLSSIAPLGRRFIMFFNAAIQGLNATYKLWKANPKRFKGWVMGYFAVGAMNAILHAMMDDDDDYLDMPQYERRNALMIGGNGAYLKWALPQEARAFYALGDIAVESMLGRNPQKFWQKGGEVGQILTTIGEVLPINPTEGWRAVAPSIAIPALELMINEDYKGEAIYNDSKWLSKEEASRTANWNTAKSGTGWLHVKIAQGLNFLTGGDKYDAGLINIRPEAIEHIVQSAFGGTIRTADKFITTISAAIDPEEDVTVSQTPFLNRVLTLNDQRYRNVHVNEVFDYYAKEAEHAKTLEKMYRKDGDSDALLDLTSSDEYKWMMIYENYKKPLENVRERLKVAEGTRERKQIMREQDELKKMMIKQISNL